jgi:hypothetical protein
MTRSEQIEKAASRLKEVYERTFSRKEPPTMEHVIIVEAAYKELKAALALPTDQPVCEYGSDGCGANVHQCGACTDGGDSCECTGCQLREALRVAVACIKAYRLHPVVAENRAPQELRDMLVAIRAVELANAVADANPTIERDILAARVNELEKDHIWNEIMQRAYEWQVLLAGEMTRERDSARAEVERLTKDRDHWREVAELYANDQPSECTDPDAIAERQGAEDAKAGGTPTVKPAESPRST